MIEIPVIPESAPFTEVQRLWLNGFLAGYFARTPIPAVGDTPAAPAAPAAPPEPLLVMFGSQTGTAEGLAWRVAKEAKQRGFEPSVLELNACEEANLTIAKKAVIVSSTWGEGDPPDNAVNFWNWLNGDTAPRLDHLQFAVLGLGDKNYAEFCGASKKFDARLEVLGARRLVPRGECDVNYEASAAAWIESLWDNLSPHSRQEPSPLNSATTDRNSNGSATSNGAGKLAPLLYNKSNPYPARLLRNILLNKPGSGKEVRHYEISLEGSGLSYEVGDALGLIPMNCPGLVNDICNALRCKGDEPIQCDASDLPFHQACGRYFDISKPSQELLSLVAQRAPASSLPSLLDPERRDELKKWLWGRGVLDLLHLLPEPLTVDEFIPLLRKLAPRLYSISSSPKAHPGEVHLTISAVRYESHGRGRKGVASTFLADRVGDAGCVKVFIQPSHGFKPPAKGDTPMIMIGPGTGIAPFRAFLEERLATGAKGRNWLFFGDQKRDSDFLYEGQLMAWQQNGLLTRLDLAFSRDQSEKVYVQHRMLENAAELWSWLEEGAHFYVCGDALRMAKDVDAALHTVIERMSGKSAEEAKVYVAKLKSEKRYQRDVY